MSTETSEKAKKSMFFGIGVAISIAVVTLAVLLLAHFTGWGI